jgi:hypothetical protein
MTSCRHNQLPLLSLNDAPCPPFTSHGASITCPCVCWAAGAVLLWLLVNCLSLCGCSRRRLVWAAEPPSKRGDDKFVDAEAQRWSEAQSSSWSDMERHGATW